MGFAILLLLPVVSFLFAYQSPSVKQQQSNKQATSNQSNVRDDSSLLEFGMAAKLRPRPANADLRIISYNIRWRSGDDLKELIKLFREDAELGNPSILALQE